MAFFDKLSQAAKNIGDRTTDAIETTKLNSKIAAEKLAANEELLKIGQHYYDLYLAGQADEAILEFCQAAKGHLDTADQLQAEIDRIKAENEAAKAAAAAPVAPAAPTGIVCTACGTANNPGTKFCCNCGNKLEIPAPPAPRSCPNCGATIADGMKFCGECGTRTE